MCVADLTSQLVMLATVGGIAYFGTRLAVNYVIPKKNKLEVKK